MIFYTLKELSELLKTPVSYFRKAISQNKLKSYFIGRQYLVSEKDLLIFLNNLGGKNDR